MPDVDSETLKREYEDSICRIVVYSIMESPINYGVNSTIAILRGAYSTFMIDHKLKQSDLSTYALLSNFTAPQLRDIINSLINAGLLESKQMAGFKGPVLQVSEKGYAFLSGEYTTDLKFIERCTQHELPNIESSNDELFRNLRTLRSRIAKEMDLPAYAICRDRVLLEITNTKPTTNEELHSIYGVGNSFVEKYGQRFIDCIKTVTSDQNKQDGVSSYDKNSTSAYDLSRAMPAKETLTSEQAAASKPYEAELIRQLRGKLLDRESDVLIKRLGLGDGRAWTLSEIGDRYGLTRERIRQIQKKACRKLRHPSRNIHIPEDFDIFEFRRDPSQYGELFKILKKYQEPSRGSLPDDGRKASASSPDEDSHPEMERIAVEGQQPAIDALADELGPSATEPLPGEPKQAPVGQVPARHGRPWTAAENTKLLKSFDEGASIAELAREHQRTALAIRCSLVRLGRIKE